MGVSYAATEEPLPEQEEIDSIILGEQPDGVLFTVMEQDEEALQWVLPRILHYTRQLRGAWEELPIAVVSHGDEMLGLVTELSSLYPEIHENLQLLVNQYGVDFHVCGSFAAMSDIDDSDFPDYVDVVPTGPAQITDYRQMGYELVSVELTW
jgi:intracellular sulfur oxidation DsrE/DsrF family protein